MIGQMRDGLHHAPGVARRAHTPAFAGKGYRQVVPAGVAVSAGKAMGEDAAFEVAAKSLFDINRRCGVIRPGRECQPSLEVGLDGAIPQRVFGPAALIAPGAGRRRFDCGRQGTTRVLG